MPKDFQQMDDMEKINFRMNGWSVDRVEEGHADEVKLIFHLVKGENKRTVFIGGNDLGIWFVK